MRVLNPSGCSLAQSPSFYFSSKLKENLCFISDADKTVEACARAKVRHLLYCIMQRSMGQKSANRAGSSVKALGSQSPQLLGAGKIDNGNFTKDTEGVGSWSVQKHCNLWQIRRSGFRKYGQVFSRDEGCTCLGFHWCVATCICVLLLLQLFSPAGAVMEVTAGRDPARAAASRPAQVRFPRDSQAPSPHLDQKQTGKGEGDDQSKHARLRDDISRSTDRRQIM